MLMRLRPVDGAARRGVRFHGVGVAPLCRSRKGDRDARAALPGGGVAGSHRTTSASWGLDTGRRRVQNAVDRRQNASDPLRKLARDNEFLRLQVAEYRPVHGEV